MDITAAQLVKLNVDEMVAALDAAKGHSEDALQPARERLALVRKLQDAVEKMVSACSDLAAEEKGMDLVEAAQSIAMERLSKTRAPST